VKDSKKLFAILAVSNFFLFFGFSIWRAIFNNFAVEELGVRADQIGLIQAIREVPGLLGFGLGFLVLWLSEMRVMGLSILLLGVGLVISGAANGLGILILGTVVMSVGFHFFYPSNSSLVLMEVGKQEAPKMLGSLRSVSSFAAIVGTLIWIFVTGVDLGPLHIPAWGYRTTLYVTGAVVIVGSVIAFLNGRRHVAQRQKRKVVFRRDYWAIFSPPLPSLCWSRSTASMFARQPPCSWSTTLSTPTPPPSSAGWYPALASETYLPVLYALFVVDNIFFSFNLALESYFQKISHSPAEITSNVSMAQTINHVSALVVPVLGGILWAQVSPSATFLAGAAIAVVSLILVQFIRTDRVRVPAAVS